MPGQLVGKEEDDKLTGCLCFLGTCYNRELLNLAQKNSVDINGIEIWVYRIDQANIRSKQEDSHRDCRVGGVCEGKQP